MFESIFPYAQRDKGGITLALGGAIDSGLARGLRAPLLVRGLDAVEFGALLDSHFPDARRAWPGVVFPAEHATPEDEFDDVVRLLLEYRSDDSRDTYWLAHALATASMYDNHLWQDLRLPNRQLLSELLLRHFTVLALRNVAHMRWKKFFYKQLCEQAQIYVCKSPICSVCCDYDLCFGAEEG